MVCDLSARAMTSHWNSLVGGVIDKAVTCKAFSFLCIDVHCTINLYKGAFGCFASFLYLVQLCGCATCHLHESV